MSKIKTYTGLWVDPLHLRASDVSILDIAHHLSCICRFNGATSSYYSVAQHSVLVSMRVGSRLKAHALIHQACHAYLGDCVRPIMERIYYRFRDENGRPYSRGRLDVECYTQSFIELALGLEDITDQDRDSIVEADRSLLTQESRDLMAARDGEGFGDVSDCWGQDSIQPLDPSSAEKLFLRFANEYGLIKESGVDRA